MPRNPIDFRQFNVNHAYLHPPFDAPVIFQTKSGKIFILLAGTGQPQQLLNGNLQQIWSYVVTKGQLTYLEPAEFFSTNRKIVNGIGHAFNALGAWPNNRIENHYAPPEKEVGIRPDWNSMTLNKRLDMLPVEAIAQTKSYSMDSPPNFDDITFPLNGQQSKVMNEYFSSTHGKSSLYTFTSSSCTEFGTEGFSKILPSTPNSYYGVDPTSGKQSLVHKKAAIARNFGGTFQDINEAAISSHFPRNLNGRFSHSHPTNSFEEGDLYSIDLQTHSSQSLKDKQEFLQQQIDENNTLMPQIESIVLPFITGAMEEYQQSGASEEASYDWKKDVIKYVSWGLSVGALVLSPAQGLTQIITNYGINNLNEGNNIRTALSMAASSGLRYTAYSSNLPKALVDQAVTTVSNAAGRKTTKYLLATPNPAVEPSQNGINSNSDAGTTITAENQNAEDNNYTPVLNSREHISRSKYSIIPPRQYFTENSLRKRNFGNKSLGYY